MYKKNYIPDIDFIRALSVLSVIIFHNFPSILPNGFFGVDIFFIISGYLITDIIINNLNNNSFSFIAFYKNRVRRILPSLFIFLIILIFFSWYLLFDNELKFIFKNLIASALFIQNYNLAYGSNYFDPSSETNPLVHLWSLSIEEQFYIFYPLMLYLSFKLTPKKIIYSMIILCILSFLYSMYLLSKNPISTYYLTQSRIWEILAGAIIAMIPKKIRNEKRIKSFKKNIFSIYILCLVIILLFMISPSNTNHPNLLSLIPILSLCFIVLGIHLEYIKSFFANKILIHIGLISYPLYIFHWGFLSFYKLVNSRDVDNIEKLFLITLSIFTASIIYSYVEKPLKKITSNLIFILLLINISSVSILYFVIQIDFNRNHFDDINSRNELFIFKDSNLDNSSIKFPEIMLLGDSHANHYFAGLNHFYKNNIIDKSQSGCIPFLNVDRYDFRSEPGSCVNHINDNLKEYVTKDNYKLLIFSSMGPINITGKSFKNMDTDREKGLVVKNINHNNLTKLEDVFRQGFRDTLEYLDKYNMKAIYILDVPELGFDIKSCYQLRPINLSIKKKKNECMLLFNEYQERNKVYKNIINNEAAYFKNILIIDPSSILCNQNMCMYEKDSTPLYRDADHLNEVGSKLIIESFKSEIDNFLYQ